MGDIGIRVHLESPWQDGKHEEYAWKCVADSIARGEAPFASHLLYTRALNDGDENERAHGMLLGDVWRKSVDLVVFYVDYGLTSGMLDGLRKAIAMRQNVEFRYVER